MKSAIRVTVWNEFRHERKDRKIAEIYPEGIHEAIASYIRSQPGFEVSTATLDEPDHGLTDKFLADTDVLIWWGHIAHKEVRDDIVDKVQNRVLDGMGLIVLHSACFSKIFLKLMGTTCNLKWREIGERERLWVVEPGHPIAEGLGEYIEIENAEMYGERFDIPQPDELVFISWFEGGEVFRSGCCFRRGKGKIFYFRPGHETYPIYHNPDVLKVIANAARWAAPSEGPKVTFGNVKPLEVVHQK
ncbi:MAG: ThuA domain-containing protein [bacterium]